MRSLPRAWWLLLVLPVLFALLGYLFIQQRGPEYTATATFRFEENPRVLVRTFESLLVSIPVLEKVIAELGLETDVATLQDQVIAEAVLGTNLYEVSVTDSNPELSAEIATALPTVFEDWYVLERTAELEEQLGSLDPDIDRLQTEMDATENQRLIDQLRTERNALLQRRQQIILEQTRLADLLSVATPAVPPADPDLMSSGLIPLGTALVGLGLGIGLVIFWEGLNPRVGAARREIESATGLPVMGPIASPARPRSARDLAADDTEMGYLGVRLGLLRSGDGIGPVVVTSAERVEERGLLPVHVALRLARDGHRAVVIECGAGLGRSYQAVGVTSDAGSGKALDTPTDLAHIVELHEVEGVPVGILPSGAPGSPLPSRVQLEKAIADLGSLADVVVVGIDPVLAAPEGLALAAGATTTLVGARVGETGIESLRETASRLAEVGAAVLGVVLVADRPGRW